MGWIASLVVAVLTAIAGLFASAGIASFAAMWYRVSSFEGGSGFFVVGLALLGGLGGFVVGLFTSRIVAARPKPRFSKALGASTGIVILLLVGVGAVGRILADIPPTIDGEELLLVTELRWPSSAASPVAAPGSGLVQLGALSASAVRVSRDGPLFLEDAHQVEGRWVVPGAVRVFTSRGSRVLYFRVGEKVVADFIVPLPGHPGSAQRDWSEWLPRSGEDAAPDRFTYRFRVVRQSEPIRSDVVGPFHVGTAVSYFYNVEGTRQLAAKSRFEVRYNGAPIRELGDVGALAVVAGGTPALLVDVERGDSHGCRLLVGGGGAPKVEDVGSCSINGRPLTSDPARFNAARDRVIIPGWIDWSTFDVAGLFAIGEYVLDTRSLSARRFDNPDGPALVADVPPLDLSPDEGSFVRFADDGSEDNPELVVTNWRANRSYTLPIDRGRMRFNTSKTLDPEWVRHHFEWKRGPDGADILAERAAFTPMPYRGEVTLGPPGKFQSYTLRPGSEPLRAAIVEILTKELGGERLPHELGGYQERVRFDGRVLNVTVGDSPSYVTVAMDPNEGDPALMKRVAAGLDAALATHRYDALFAK
jgi:hypothetical protein